MVYLSQSPYLWAALPLVLWFAQYLLRKLAPSFWEWCANLGPFGAVDLSPALTLARKVWQALPSVVGGAVIMALMSGGDVRAAALGALKGALAPLLHELLKAAPIPYQGATNTAKIPISALLVLVGLFTACGGSHPPPCVPATTGAIVADCRMQYRRAGCADDPDGKCPEIVKACDARVDALTDQEVCTP